MQRKQKEIISFSRLHQKNFTVICRRNKNKEYFFNTSYYKDFYVLLTKEANIKNAN